MSPIVYHAWYIWQLKAEPLEHKHEAEQYVRFVAIDATPTATNTRELEEASATDDELRNVRRAIKAGCFDECKLCAPIVGELYASSVSKLVLLSTRIILPAKFQPRAVALAHKGHLGLVST